MSKHFVIIPTNPNDDIEIEHIGCPSAVTVGKGAKNEWLRPGVFMGTDGWVAWRYCDVSCVEDDLESYFIHYRAENRIEHPRADFLYPGRYEIEYYWDNIPYAEEVSYGLRVKHCTCDSPCCSVDIGVGVIDCGSQHCPSHGKHHAEEAPVCFRCGKSAYETDAYDPYMGPDDTRAMACRREEGTYNPDQNTFACDECYLAIGMPSSPSGWRAPARGVVYYTDEV